METTTREVFGSSVLDSPLRKPAAVAKPPTSEVAQSPFLPGTQIQFAWDSTSLGYLKTCPRLYQYHMILGYGVKEDNVHLRFGIEFHQALQDYDIARAKGDDHESALRTIVRELIDRTADFDPDPDTRPGKYKSRRNLLGLVIDYLDHFKDDPAQTVILEDGRPAVELSFRFELDWGPKAARAKGKPYSDETAEAMGWGQPYLLSGHLDRVVSFNSELYVMDHKTAMTTISQYYFDQYHPNNQMTLYTIAGQVVIGTPIRGVIIDAAQILLEKPNNFQRGMTFRTAEQIEEWFADLRITLAQAEGYATAGYWPMNDTACDKFGGCRFRKVCSASPQVREVYLNSDFVKQEESQKWNPLRPR